MIACIRDPAFPDNLRDFRHVPVRKLTGPLLSLLHSQDQDIKKRAATALGILVSGAARQDMEQARDVMRRLMWSLNHESGSIGWGAAEAMAEIMARHPGLAEEYLHLLLSYLQEDGNYVENPALQQELLRAVLRVAPARMDLLEGIHADRFLEGFLNSEDAGVRALAARCMRLFRTEEASRKRHPGSTPGRETK